MLAYLILLPIIYIFNDYWITKDKQISNRSLVIFLLISSPLVIMGSLKDLSVGSDMVFYEHGYRHIGNLNILELREWGWEIGYVFLNWFLYKFGLSFRIFMILYNLFVFSSLGLLIKKN